MPQNKHLASIMLMQLQTQAKFCAILLPQVPL